MKASLSTLVVVPLLCSQIWAETLTLDFTNLIHDDSIEPAVSIQDGNQIVKTKLGSGSSYVTRPATADTPAFEFQQEATALTNWAYPEDAKWVKQQQAIDNDIYLEFTVRCAENIESITGVQIDYVAQGKKAPKKATCYVSSGKSFTATVKPKSNESDKIKLQPTNQLQASTAVSMEPVATSKDHYVTVRLYFWDYPPKENNKSKLYIDKINLTTN